MKKFLVPMLALALLSPTAAHAATVDFCAKKSTGVVREVTDLDPSGCTAKELSLGATAIHHGATRPTALDPLMYNRFKAAKAAARKAGYVLSITSGWRSVATQKKLFKRSVKRNGPDQKWVLPWNLSDHPWGTAIDVNYNSSKKKGDKAHKWLQKYGYKWGLCRRYQNEWWHFEPLVAPGQKCPAPQPYPVW